MAKFLFQGRSPKQTRTFHMAKRTFNIETTKADDGDLIGSVKQPEVYDYIGLDPRSASIFKTVKEELDTGTPLTIGYEWPAYATSDRQRAWRSFDLDFIANWFANKSDDYDNVLMFGFPLGDGTTTVDIGDSLIQAKYLVRKKDTNGKWDTIVDAATDEVVFRNETGDDDHSDHKAVDVYFYAHHLKNLDDLILINMNVQKCEITEDITTADPNHKVEMLIDNMDYALSSEILSPLPIYANYNGQSVITTPKDTFRLRPYKSMLVNKLGLNTDNIKMQVRTALRWEKLDNGDLEFTWTEGMGTSTYITLIVPLGDTIGDIEHDALVCNFYVFKQ